MEEMEESGIGIPFYRRGRKEGGWKNGRNVRSGIGIPSNRRGKKREDGRLEGWKNVRIGIGIPFYRRGRKEEGWKIGRMAEM